MRTRWMVCALLIVGACDCDEPMMVGDATVDTFIPRDTTPPDPMCLTALPVDLLFVVDNSNSMAEEQQSLAENFPALVAALTEPRDTDGDGTPDPPIRDLRVAVLSTDLGVSDAPGIPGCPAGPGDDGVFISASRAEGDCAGVDIGAPPWIEFTGDNADEVSASFGCLARLGTTGCGLEQQLEAMKRALSDHRATGGPHDGFLRPSSFLAVVFVTDEDDCSASDPRAFDNSASVVSELGPLSNRCAYHPELLHPVSRYIDVLRGLTLDRPGVLVAAITGVPRDLTSDPENVDFDALLADERMQFRDHDIDRGRLAPACSFGGVANAPPARRIVELVKDFAEDGSGLALSICEPDLRPAIEVIGQRVREQICPPPI